MKPLILAAFLLCAPLAFAQSQVPSVSLGWSIDTTASPTREIVATVTDYLRLPSPGRTPTDVWAADEQGQGNDAYDPTAWFVYIGYPATIVQITPTWEATEAYVVKILYANADSAGIVRPIALQRFYASEEDGRWVLRSALPILTRDWLTVDVGRITYHRAPGASFDSVRAQRAARFVDSVAAFVGVPPPVRLEYYLTESVDEMYRIVGLDWFVQQSGPGTGRGARTLGNRTILCGNPEFGEAYVHEIAHLVLLPTKGPTGPHRLIVEGAATWFGGSTGHSLDELLTEIVAFQEKNPEFRFEDLNGGVLPDREGERLWNGTGALVVDAVYRKGGQRALRSLLAVGPTDDDLRRRLRELLGEKTADFDAWWRSEARETLTIHSHAR